MPNFDNCSGFSDGQLHALVALRGSTSSIACVALVAFLIVICACRSRLGLGKEEKLLKASLFALFGVSVCYLAVLSLGPVYHLLPPANAGTWCAIFGCFDQILSVLQITLLFVNTGPIMIILCSDMAGKRQNDYRQKAKRAVKLLMGATVVFAVLIMIASAIVPFVTRTYGAHGGWCWIYSRDKNCKQIIAGFLEQIFLWLAFYLFISLVCVIMMLMAVILLLKECWKVKKLLDSSKILPKIKKTCRKYIFQVVILIPLFLDAARFASISPVHTYDFNLWVVYALASPIIGFLIPLSFFLYIKYGKRCNDGSVNNPEGNGRSMHYAADVLAVHPSSSTAWFTADDVSLARQTNLEQIKQQHLLKLDNPEDNGGSMVKSYSSAVYVSTEDDASITRKANVGEEDKQHLLECPTNE